jgi:hypothetical protein
MDSGLINTGYIASGQWVMTPGGSPGLWTTATVNAPQSRFVEIGHWLCGWLAAAVGGLAAGWIARRRQREPQS